MIGRPTLRWRRLGGIAVASVVCAAVTIGCIASSDAQPSDTPPPIEDSTAPSPDPTGSTASTGPGSSSVASIAEPVPPLPADISPVIYGVGELAAMGNVQAVLRSWNRGSDAVELVVDLENGALDDVTLRAESFRIYVADGSSVRPTNDSADALEVAFSSGERRTVTLTFDVARAAEIVLLVFDGALYGDRVSSVSFALD